MALAALLLIVPIVAGLPFAHVGEITGEGQFYRAYFTADYVWRRAVVAELAKGAFLPVNPYFQGDALHYYWMPHVLTAVQYRFAEAWATLDELLLVRSVFIDAFFVALLYGTVRMFGVRPWASAAGVAFVIVSSSFEGLYALYDFWSNGAPLAAVRNLNIDAISRWYMHGIPIDGLQRLLFYQPHHAVGYAMGLLGLYSVSHRARPRDAAAMFVSGLLLALSILISSFAGLMFTAAAALFEGVAVVRTLDWRRAIAHALAAGIPLAIGTALVFALGYVDTGGSVVAFGLNRLATQSFWLVTTLSFGPVLIISAAAIALAVSAKRSGLGVFAALAGACVIFYFFINVRDHQDVYVGWRVGHLLFMAAAVLAGIVFERAEGASTPARIAAWVAIAIVTAQRTADDGDRYLQHAGPVEPQRSAGVQVDTRADARRSTGLRLDPPQHQARRRVPGRSGRARFGNLGLLACVRGAANGGGPADLDGAAAEISGGFGPGSHDLRRDAVVGLRARGSERHQLHHRRSARADGAPGCRAAIRFARPVDARRISQRHHFDLRGQGPALTPDGIATLDGITLLDGIATLDGKVILDGISLRSKITASRGGCVLADW